MKRIGKTLIFNKEISILSSAAVVGPKEGAGPLKEYFDIIEQDSFLGQDSWEKAESVLQKEAIEKALEKSNFNISDIDIIFAGDLLNQCTASTFGVVDFSRPFIGIYGACSTMALTLINASIYVECDAAQKAIAVTSSHFCAAERQYRFPLEYGGVRPLTSQWTVTGSGAAIIGIGGKIRIKGCTVGNIADLGVKDANNMGAAMAPDDVKIRPYPINEGMVFFYTQIQYLRGFRALFKDFLTQKIVEKSVNEIYAQSRNYYKKEEEF